MIVEKGKYIQFETSDLDPNLAWIIRNTKEGVAIAWIEWYPSWRKYVFVPGPNTCYEEVCLREIAAFIEKQTRARKASKRKE